MSRLNADMMSLTMAEANPNAGNNPSTMSTSVSGVVDLTLSSDDDDSESDDGSNNSGNQDHSENESDSIMLDGPPQIFRSSSSNDQTHQSVALPQNINWPKIMIIGAHVAKCLIGRQFITPVTFTRRLDAENPHLEFIIPQYKVAWVHAVNRCREKVDLTGTIEAYPGLGKAAIEAVIDDQFDEVLQRVETAKLRTRAELLGDLQFQHHDTKFGSKKERKLQRKLQRLTTPRNKKYPTKAEEMAAKDYITDARFADHGLPKIQTGAVKKAGGSWGTAGKTFPLTHNRMQVSTTRPHSSSSNFSPAIKDTRKQELIPGPILTSASDWYTQTNSLSSPCLDAGPRDETTSSYTPFQPYTPLRFSSTSNWRGREKTAMDICRPDDEPHRPQADLYRPRPDSYRPENESHRQEADTYRPRPGAYIPPHLRSPEHKSFAPVQSGSTTHRRAPSPKRSYQDSSAATSTPAHPLPLFASRGATSLRLSKNPPSYPIMAIPPGTPTDPQGHASTMGVRTENLLPESRDEHFKYYDIKDEMSED